MPLSRASPGARLAAVKLQTRQPSKMAERHCDALAAGRKPGKPGAVRKLVGSMGGANGGRAAKRAVAALAAGRKPGRRGRPTDAVRLRPAASNPTGLAKLASPPLRTLVRKPGRSTSQLGLLEVCAYPGSVLSNEWACNGRAAVRIVFRVEGVPLSDGPEPLAGRALDWALDLHKFADKLSLRAYAKRWRPDDLWTSPDCTTRSSLQHINKHKYPDGRPAGEAAATRLLRFCRTLHRDQQSRGQRSHHEQSARCHDPFDATAKPWAISSEYRTAKCAGCAVGLREPTGRKRLLRKEWQIESTSDSVLAALRSLRCPGGHEHGSATGSVAAASAGYTRAFACIVYSAVMNYQAA